jgi:iron complex outermembrane receptor protein
LRVLEEAEEGEGEHDAGHEEEEAFGTVENTDSETSGGALGFSIVGDRGFFGISFSGFESEYGIPGHHHHEEHEEGEEGEHEHGEEEEEFVRIDLEQERVDFKGEYDLDGDFLQGVRFVAAMNDYMHMELEGDEIGTLYDTQGRDARLELRHAQWGPLVGAIGLQYEVIEFDAIGDEAFVPASDTRRKSLFLFEELSLSDNWVLQGSARYEDQSISGSTLVEAYDDSAVGASIGTIWRATDALRLSANLALTERHPTSTELFAEGAHVAVQRYERGSTSPLRDDPRILDKENSTNLDITLHGDTDRLEWSITGYINAVDDYILLRPTDEEIDEFQVFEYDQADVEFTGFEAEAIVELWDRDDSHMHVRVFADYVRAKEDASSANLPRIPPQRFGLGLHGGWRSFDASIDATFANDQKDVAENELPTEGYTLLNASLSYTFPESGLFLFMRGSNLLDEEIRQHTSPLKDLIPLPGRSLQAGLRYEF